MATATIDFPPDVFTALKKTPEEFTKEIRIAAAIQWYAEGVVSQGKAASIAGITRAEFIDELCRRKVPVSQATIEEIDQEREFGQQARRQRITTDTSRQDRPDRLPSESAVQV